MKIITVATLKGGAGKTTLALSGALLGEGAALLDLDPQESAKKIMIRREAKGLPTPPYGSVTYVRVPQALKSLQEDGVERVIIDVPPYVADKRALREAAGYSDLVVMPFRPSILDLDVMKASIEAIGEKSFVVVMNFVSPNASNAEDVMPAIEKLLEGTKGKVCPYRLGNRVAQSDALSVGQIASEYDKNGKAAQEMQAVWDWIAGEVE